MKLKNLIREAISIGDNVIVKKSAPVVDKKFIGKMGVVMSVNGQKLTIEFPNGRTISLSKKDVELGPIDETINEALTYQQAYDRVDQLRDMAYTIVAEIESMEEMIGDDPDKDELKMFERKCKAVESAIKSSLNSIRSKINK